MTATAPVSGDRAKASFFRCLRRNLSALAGKLPDAGDPVTTPLQREGALIDNQCVALALDLDFVVAGPAGCNNRNVNGFTHGTG